MNQLMQSFVLKSMYQVSILGVTSCSNCFRPQKHRCLGEYQHGSCSFYKRTVSSFNNSILLRSAWDTLLVGDANTFVKLNELLDDKLRSIVCPDDSNGFVESCQQLFDEFYDNLWSHVLGSQKPYPCKLRIVDDYHQNILLPIYTLHTHWSAWVHVKGVKNLHDGIDSFGFVSMLLSFAQLTSRTKMFFFKL